MSVREQMKKLSPFKFWVGASTFEKCTHLFRSLDEALLLKTEWHYSMGPISAGHPDAQFPHNTVKSSPLRNDLAGWPWTVLRVSHLSDGGEPFIRYLGEFGEACDAFQFAKLKTEQAKKHNDSDRLKYYVCLWASSENGCRPEIARLPADHLDKLHAARNRAERLRDRAEQRKRIYA